MKKAKHLLSLTLTGIFSIVLVLGLCGVIEAQDTVYIDFMDFADNEVFVTLMAERYAKANPNIKVRFSPAPAVASEYHNKLVTILASGDTETDIIDTDVVWPPEFVAGGWLAPLDEYISEEELAEFVPATVLGRTIGGRLYGIPWFHDIGVFLWRSDILDEAGIEPPIYWMEMVEIAQKLQDPPNLYGFVTCFNRSAHIQCGFDEFLWSNNGVMSDDPPTKMLINSPAGVEALEFMVDLVNKYKITQPGVTSMGLDEGRQIFTQGNALFHRNWIYAGNLAEQEDSKVKGKVGVGPLPKFPGGRHAQNLGGWAYSVNALSPYIEESALFSRFLASREVQKERALTQRQTPSLIDLFADPDLVAKYPHYAGILEANKWVMWRLKSPFYAQISDIMALYLQKAIIGEMSPKEALDAAVEEANFLLAE